MSPERTGLKIAHDEAALPEFSRNLEDEAFLVFFDLGGIHDAVETEMSPGGGNGLATEFVVDDLAARTIEHVDGVSP